MTRRWITNDINYFIWAVITCPCHISIYQITIEDMPWLSNYIPHVYMDVIAYPCPHLSAGIICYKTGSRSTLQFQLSRWTAWQKSAWMMARCQWQSCQMPPSNFISTDCLSSCQCSEFCNHYLPVLTQPSKVVIIVQETVAKVCSKRNYKNAIIIILVLPTALFVTGMPHSKRI